MTVIDDFNVNWGDDDGLVQELERALPGWEAWLPDEDQDPEEASTCAYCTTDEPPFTEHDPYGGKPCCRACFLLLIGGDEDDG